MVAPLLRCVAAVLKAALDAWLWARSVVARKSARVLRAMRTWRRDAELRAARTGRRGHGWRLATNLFLRRATNRAARGCRDSEDFSPERSDPAAGKACAPVHRLLPAWLFPRRCDSPRRT